MWLNHLLGGHIYEVFHFDPESKLERLTIIWRGCHCELHLPCNKGRVRQEPVRRRIRYLFLEDSFVKPLMKRLRINPLFIGLVLRGKRIFLPLICYDTRMTRLTPLRLSE